MNGTESQQVGSVGQHETGICPVPFRHRIRKCLSEKAMGSAQILIGIPGRYFLLMLDSNYSN